MYVHCTDIARTLLMLVAQPKVVQGVYAIGALNASKSARSSFMSNDTSQGYIHPGPSPVSYYEFMLQC